MRTKPLVALVAGIGLLVTACGGGGNGGGGEETAAAVPTEAAGGNTVAVGLGETDATHMYMNLNQSSVPAGPVTFVVTNEGAKEHEFVVLRTDTPAGDFPVMSKGEAMAMAGEEGMGHMHDFNEDVQGIENVGEIEKLASGATDNLTLTLEPGHYALVCNIRGHYSTGMRADLQVGSASGTTVSVALGETDATHMYLRPSQTSAPTGKVTFVVTNEGTKTHEFVVLKTDTKAADFPIVTFEGEPNRIDEDAPGVKNVGETGDMEPGTTQNLSVDLQAGHYALVCNLKGHYAAGMYADFEVT